MGLVMSVPSRRAIPTYSIQRTEAAYANDSEGAS